MKRRRQHVRFKPTAIYTFQNLVQSIPHSSCKVPYDRCIACCVRVGCWNQQCKTITYIVSTAICISARGLLHVCHVNVSSKKILGKAVFYSNRLQKFYCQNIHASTGITIDHITESVSTADLSLFLLFSQGTCTLKQATTEILQLDICLQFNIPPTVHELEPHCSETATQMLRPESISKSL